MPRQRRSLGGVTTRRHLAGAEYAHMEQSEEGRVAPQSSRSSHPDRYRSAGRVSGALLIRVGE